MLVQPMSDHQRQIEAALWRLLDSGPESFVVIEVKATGRIVQFAADSERLILDLPVHLLTEDERRRAEAFFAEIGEFHAESQAFGAVLERDPRAAAKLAAEVLSTVYQASALAPIAIETEFTPAGTGRDPGPQRLCSLCGEGATDLKRRLWFRHWSEVVAGEGPPVELQAVCAGCRGAEQRQSLIFLGVLVVVVIIAAAVVAWALF